MKKIKVTLILLFFICINSCQKPDIETSTPVNGQNDQSIETNDRVDNYDIIDAGSGSSNFNPVYEKLLAPYTYKHFCQLNSSSFPNDSCLPVSYMIGKGLFRNIEVNNQTLQPIINGMLTSSSGSSGDDGFNYIKKDLGTSCATYYTINNAGAAFDKIYNTLNDGYPLICLINIKRNGGGYVLETNALALRHFVLIVGIRVENFSNHSGEIWYIDPLSKSAEFKVSTANIFLGSSIIASKWKSSNLIRIGCNSDAITSNYFTPTVDTNISRIISLSGNLVYGNVIIGSPQTKSLIITNNGNTALTINSISLPTGYSSNYNPGTIAAGSSITANITFNPQNMVTNYNGTITVNSNATSGVNTINVSGSGTNSTPTPTPTFNPTINSSTGCFFNNETGSGQCAGSDYLGSTINVKVASYNQSNNTITFTISKCSGSFLNSGIAYIKQGDYCGTVAAQVNYNKDVSNITLSVTPPTKTGNYKYTAVLVSATTDKFYSLPINVQY